MAEWILTQCNARQDLGTPPLSTVAMPRCTVLARMRTRRRCLPIKDPRWPVGGGSVLGPGEVAKLSREKCGRRF